LFGVGKDVLGTVLAYLCGTKPFHLFIVLIAVTLFESWSKANEFVAAPKEHWASLSGKDSPNYSCASKQIFWALSLSSFTEAFVQAFSDQHYHAEQISKTKHNECR